MTPGSIGVRARRHGRGSACCLLAAIPATAHAADGVIVATSAAVAVLAGVVFLSRRRPIGGWLLLFPIYLYASLLGSVASLFVNRANLEPGGWDERGPWLAYLGSLVPQTLALAWAGLAALHLFAPAGRGPGPLARLRRALAIYIGCSFLAVAIDFAYWPAQVGIDLITIALGLCWLAYLRYSKRVRRILGSRSMTA